MDYDLTGVSPERQRTMRARIAAILAFDAIDRPTQADAAAAAASVGLGASQFMRLVRAWRLHRDARRLPGAGAVVERPSRASPAAAVVAEVLRSSSVEASLTEVRKRVAALCDERGLAAPSYATVWAAANHAPREVSTNAILATTISLAIPVRTASSIGFPRVCLAMAIGERRVLSCREVPDREHLSERTIEDVVVASEPTAPPRPLAIDCGASLLARLADRFPDLTLRAAREVLNGMSRATILGPTIGGIRIMFGRHARLAPKRTLRALLDQALDPIEATGAIAEAVARHNEEIPEVRFSI